jgi:hypothetical protein
MSEDTADPTVPDWVRRMRADGYTVRIGTGTGGLPYEPEVSFTPPRPPRRGIVRRLIAIARKRWQGGAVFKGHANPPERHAPLP